MADFPYTAIGPKIKDFFAHIQEASVPEKVSINYLEKAGFKSKNDRMIIPVLKFIGFLDSSGKPTPLWTDYRNKAMAGRVLAGAIRSSYSSLFAMYADANRKDLEALRNFFTHGTTVSAGTVGRIVETFRHLCSMADFEGAPISPKEVPVPAGSAPPPPPTESQRQLVSQGTLVPININIQLELPATENAEIYDKLFAAMKKHLLTP